MLILLWPSQSSYAPPPTKTYINQIQNDQLSHQVYPNTHLRTSSIFKNTSAESWPFQQPNKSSMINAIGRGPINGIPAVPTTPSAPYNYDEIEGMNI